MVYDYEFLKKEIAQITGIDLHAYKERQMKRRIDAYMTRSQMHGYEDFVERLKQDVSQRMLFTDYLTINVTEFFRNPKRWEYLDSVLIPKLVNQFGSYLSVWSCACSTGEEAYSAAMLLAEHIPVCKIHVLATDLNPQVLSFAKEGIYPEKSIKNIPERFKNKYFIKNGDFYAITPEIKKRVLFKQQNLLKDEFPHSCHFILCRNIFIYFTEETKDKLFTKMNEALSKDGYLFMGSTEQIINYKELGFDRENSFFYRKQK